MLLSLSFAFAADYTLYESLAAGTSGATYGGTFTGSGWRVDDSNSRLFWDFGTQVNSGTVSFTTDDVTFENLTGDNNEFIQLFDTGDKWSCNHAVTVRVYGSDTDWGDIKLKTWDNVAGLWSEARGGVQDWDGNPHTWTVYWDETVATLSRDGVEIIALDVTGQDLSVGTLWLPLNTWNYGYSHPLGSIYSNLSVEAWEPGADEPDEPDDGVADDGGLSPMEDVGTTEWDGGVYADADDLPLDGTSEMSYLMFDTSAYSGTVTSATLRLHARADSHASGDGGTLYAVPDTTWSEDSLTWATRPTLGAVISAFGAVSPSDTLEFDVTGYVTAGGRVAFALYGGGSDTAHFSSKEDGDGSGAASLVLTVADDGGTDDGTDDGSTDDGGADDEGSDEGTDGDTEEGTDEGAEGEAPGDGGADGRGDQPGEPSRFGVGTCSTVDRGALSALLAALVMAGRRRRS